jgi:hypothetical protein
MRILPLLGLSAALFRLQAADDLKPGLIGEYYEIGEELNDFPNIKGMTPSLRRIDADVNIQQTNGQFNKSGLILQFYVRWTGVIRVPKDGRYMFYTESDDGSRLSIDGKLVVDNGGLHPPEEKNGEAELKAGPHEIRIDFFQAGGGACCKVKWASDDFKTELVPARVLFHKKDKELDE